MKRQRSLVGWGGLGLAVAAIAGGAYAGKRYAEQNMLSGILGAGVKAESVQWHWRQAAGCAEQVEIPLPYAKDAQDQALQLYAPKLWFVYDQAALLRKRFVLPRVVIEDAVVSTSTDRMLSSNTVDVDFGAGVDLEGLVELPSEAAEGSSTEFDISAQSGSAGSSPASTSLSDICASKPSGLSMPWLDQLQSMCDSVINEKSLRGRQVSIDAQMVSERMQAFFGDNRLQAQRLIADAREIQQQLSSMDNVLRQPQLDEVRRRLEIIRDQLAKLKFEVSHSDKRFDDERSQLRSSLLAEKKQLQQQAEQCAAEPAADVSAVVLSHLIKEQMAQPTRAVIFMADLMRKPLDAGARGRGESLRYLDQEQPEFAARSARISGKMEIDGAAWPFKAEGSFEVATSMLDAANASSTEPGAFAAGAAMMDSSEQFTHPVSVTKGSAKWQMSVDAQPSSWQLNGECPRVDGPCKIELTDTNSDMLRIGYTVDHASISGQGQVALRELIGSGMKMERMADSFAAQYRAEALLRKLMSEALVVDDQTPEAIEFKARQWQSAKPSSENTALDCEIGDAAIEWLGGRLQTAATGCLADVYRQAAVQLENLITSTIGDQQSMMATLRNDTEQYISAQQDELRRIQAMVNSLIEQRQASYFFARQPGEMPR